MNCCHPSYAVKIGVKENGNADLKMLGYRPDDRDRTLQKRDFQLLMKRIRKKYSADHIQFFMSGEYGSETFRPH